MIRPWALCLLMLVLSPSMVSTIHAQATTMAAWGDTRLLGFTDVGAPVVWEPRIFNRAFDGKRLDQILHLSSNDYGTIAYTVDGIYGWGGFSPLYRHAQKYIMSNESYWLDDPIKEIVGAGGFWMALTESGNVSTWSAFTKEIGCKPPWEAFGLGPDYVLASCESNLGKFNRLSFPYPEPISQVGCTATYCIAISQDKVFNWGTDPSSSFGQNFSSDTMNYVTPASPSEMRYLPTGFRFTHVAVARHGSPSDWFVVVGKNSTHHSVIFSTAYFNLSNDEDYRFLNSGDDLQGTPNQYFLMNSAEAALPQDFSTSWISLGLDHGVIASTNRIFVWGSNKFSQLGIDTIPGSYIPLELTSSFPSGTIFSGLSVNKMTSYVLTSSGELYVFGPTRICDELNEKCIEESAAYYGRTEIRRTTGKIGPTLLPLPITAKAPPTFSHIPTYTDGRVLSEDSTAFHVLGVVKDGIDEEPFPPLPAEAILGWGTHFQASHDVSGRMPFGIDVGNFTSSAQLMSIQKPTLVALPSGTRSISMLSTLWHSASALVDVDGVLVPYIWGSMLHNETFATPNMTESPNYVAYPPTTYSYPVNMTSKLDSINSGNTPLRQLMWANAGLIGQYANLNVSYSRFDVPDVWIEAISSTAIDDEISCSTRACGILQKSDGQLTVWSMDTTSVDDGINECYRMGLSGTCSSAPRIVTDVEPVLKFSLADTMSVVVLARQTDSIQTSGYYDGYADIPVLGTTSIKHTGFMPINFTHLEWNFPGSAVVCLSVGYQYSMFIVDFGGTKWIFGFGSNNHGQIVGRNFDSGLLPTRLPEDWVDGEPTYIACVRETTFLLTMEGNVQKVFVWGYNGFGQMYGFGGVYNSISSVRAHIFELPDYLGTKYIVKSFSQGESASTVFAHLAPSGTSTPYRAPDNGYQGLMAIGSDVTSINSDFPRMLPQFYGIPTLGTELGRGQIDASETITKTAVGRYTTWHLVDGKRLYGSGLAACLPLIDANATIDAKTMLWEPSLFLDMSDSSESIVDISAHDVSVAFLLSNKTAGFMVPSNPACPPSAVIPNDAYASMEPYLVPDSYDKINCGSKTCCFYSTNLVNGYGEAPQVIGKRNSMLSMGPTFNLKISNVRDLWVVGDSEFVYRKTDGLWYRNSYQWESAVSGLENRIILQVASGRQHTLVNTDVGMFTMGHSNTHVNQANFTNYSAFFPYYQNMGYTNVTQVAVWGYRSIWVNGTDIWYAGLELWRFATTVTMEPAPWRAVAPERIILPAGAEMDQLISRNTISSVSDPTNQIIMVTVKPKTYTSSPTDGTAPIHTFSPIDVSSPVNVSSPIDASPTDVSSPIDVSPIDAYSPIEAPTPVLVVTDMSCPGNAPFRDCTCSDLVWNCVGSFILDASSAAVTISNQVVIEGDLTVTGQGALTINLGNLDSSNGQPFLRASGCIALLQPVNIVLNKEAVTSVPSGKSGKEVKLMESSCYQSNTDFVNIEQTEKKCRKISSQPAENKDSNARVTLSVIFRVQSDSCDHWWIILVSFFGTAIVVVSVILLIFVKSGTVQLMIQPYRGTNT